MWTMAGDIWNTPNIHNQWITLDSEYDLQIIVHYHF